MASVYSITAGTKTTCIPTDFFFYLSLSLYP